MYWYLMLLDLCFKYLIKIGVNFLISVNLFRNLCVCDKYYMYIYNFVCNKNILYFYFLLINLILF